jgi:4-hydroxythreonine-4-phosphate dehydrogenase
MTPSPLLAITIGDPAGIGPEIVAKSLADDGRPSSVRLVVIGDAGVLAEAVEGCRLEVEIRPVRGPSEVSGDPNTLELIDLANVDVVRHGAVDPALGQASIDYIEEACRLACAGEVEGIITAPITKEAIRAAGSTYPGHTEMLAELLGVSADEAFTMFVLDRLRIFFLTRHYPLTEAIARITPELVTASLVRIARLLAGIGIPDPRLALAALNPHAGENRLLGSEEQEILSPAVDAARAAGVDVVGPVPADAVFFQCRQGRYDAVLCLYHDQGHIAAKTVDFFGTVSCTLGLPVIRTSVDHGTAYDIAGRWIAEAGGQLAATRAAAELAPLVRKNARDDELS